MVGSLLRGGTVGAVLTVSMTIGLASTLAACASTTTAANGSPVGAAGAASGTSGTPIAPSPPTSAPPTSSSTPSTPASANPGGPVLTTLPTPPPQPTSTPFTAPPPKSKYVQIDQETQSADGRTLYLGIEAHGGACGQYVVVLQQSATEVRVGLAQLMPRVGVMCPDYVAPRTYPVSLSSPVGSRPVIDLATGGRLGS